MKAEHQTSATSSPSGINASDVLSIPAGMEGTAYLDLNFSTLSQGDAWIVFSIESVDGKESDVELDAPINSIYSLPVSKRQGMRHRY